MSEELKRLQAQVEAQSVVIEELLGVCVQFGLADPWALAEGWRAVRRSPTFIAADAGAKRRLSDELEAWAEVAITRRPGPLQGRCRSSRP